ncbi:hypothetical protein Sme01_15990 [Sphaerisporangium melleum]|uniref:Protein kinase domain-containing protein n=1 Tax=Sphaerisporangium melleum TaxID=321316 RepID=A0A917RKF8_9ACTN|nr:hypothetical protein GCM10007964_61050 [Sphaerisporangium melleum]GII69123.1 hypothetical protein Sme01_15990 [Sphaerisporangium melleum]
MLPDDPQQVGEYLILGRLGQGPRGMAYLGRRSGDTGNTSGQQADGAASTEASAAGDGRLFVIKLLPSWPEAGDEARGRVIDELSAAQRVSSAYAVRSVDAGWLGDRAYVVREHVEGRSLRETVEADGPLTGDALERAAVGTLTALTAIHLAGIAHRGLSPDNVLLGPDGPRVCDFGLGETAPRSPEQVRGEPTGPAADLFAWANAMAYAATGADPFGGDAQAVATAGVDLGRLPTPLRDVVAACLAKAPAERPTAQGAMLWLLGEAKPDSPAPALPAAPVAGLPVPGAPVAGPVPAVPGAPSTVPATAGTSIPGTSLPGAPVSGVPVAASGAPGEAVPVAGAPIASAASTPGTLGGPGAAGGPGGQPPAVRAQEPGGEGGDGPAALYAAEPQLPAQQVWGAPALPSEETGPRALPAAPRAAGEPAPPAAPARKKTGTHFPIGLAAGVGVVIGLSGLGLWGAGHYAASPQQIGRVAAEGRAGTNVPEPSTGSADVGGVGGVGESPRPRPQVTAPWATSPAPEETGVYPMELTTPTLSLDIPSFSPGPQFTPPPIPSTPPSQVSTPSPSAVPTVTVTATPGPTVSPSAEPTPRHPDKPNKPNMSPDPDVNGSPTPSPSGAGSPTPTPTPSGPQNLLPNGTPTPAVSPSRTPKPTVSGSSRPIWSRPASPRPTVTRTITPRPTPGRSVTPAPKPSGSQAPARNPYTPQQVCNASGRGSGFYVQRQSPFGGGVTYQLYSVATGSTCVVTLKTQNIGTESPVSVTLEVQGAAPVSDRGAFKFYAGPVVMQSKGKCVRFSGTAGANTTAVPFANCG